MILLTENVLENLEMTSEQIASLQPALAKRLEQFRPFFERHKTFSYLEKHILGLLSDVKRKSIEPIALAAGVAVRTLQEFLAFFCWDEDRAGQQLIRLVAGEHGHREAIGVLDASGHCKQGDKTPGVQRQGCGESGKIDLASRIAMYFLANETQRLRGEKPADPVGAGRGGGEHVGLEYLEPLAPLAGLGNGEVQVLSMAKSALL